MLAQSAASNKRNIANPAVCTPDISPLHFGPMRRTALFLAAVCLLAGCSLQKKATYALTFNVNNDSIREELIWSSLRLMERQADALKTHLTDKEVTPGSGTGAAFITIALQHSKRLPEMTAELTRPFSLRFMLEVPKGTGDFDTKDQGSFKDTGVGGQDVFWAESAKDNLTGKGAVRLLFSKEGYERMRTLIDKNRNKNIGLFVQDKIVSKMLADSLKQDVVIRNIPNGDIADAFADQVKVGLHVTFTLQP